MLLRFVLVLVCGPPPPLVCSLVTGLLGPPAHIAACTESVSARRERGDGWFLEKLHRVRAFARGLFLQTRMFSIDLQLTAPLRLWYPDLVGTTRSHPSHAALSHHAQDAYRPRLASFLGTDPLLARCQRKVRRLAVPMWRSTGANPGRPASSTCSYCSAADGA